MFGSLSHESFRHRSKIIFPQKSLLIGNVHRTLTYQFSEYLFSYKIFSNERYRVCNVIIQSTLI